MPKQDSPNLSSPAGFSRRKVLKSTLLFSSGLLAGGTPLKSLSASLAGVPEGSGMHFLSLGDFGTNNKNQRKVATAMADFAKQLGQPLEAVLALGDNFYGKLTPETIRPRFSGYYPRSRFDCPWFSTLGNHDYGPQYDSNQGVLKAGMQLDYSAKHPHSRWKMPAKWYAREFGPAGAPLVKIIFLDGNFFPGAMTPQEKIAQRRWLKQELAKPTKAKWVWAVSHYPVFSFANARRTKERQHLLREWKDLFADPRVSLYLAGHDHTLQHIRHEGMRQDFIVSGGGGASRHEVAGADKNFSMSSRGFNHIHVTPEKTTVRFINSNGKLLHTFERDPSGKTRVLT